MPARQLFARRRAAHSARRGARPRASRKAARGRRATGQAVPPRVRGAPVRSRLRPKRPRSAGTRWRGDGLPLRAPRLQARPLRTRESLRRVVRRSCRLPFAVLQPKDVSQVEESFADPGLDAPKGCAEPVGNFLVGEPVEEGQLDHLSLRGRECVEGESHTPSLLLGECIGERALLRYGPREVRRERGPTLRGSPNKRFVPAASQTVQGTAARHGGEVSEGTRAPRLVAPSPLPDLPEHLDEHVLRLAAVSEESNADGEKPWSVAIVEFPQGGAIRRSHRRHQDLVVPSLMRNHPISYGSEPRSGCGLLAVRLPRRP